MDPQERYYTYWGLTKPPFDNVPDPEMYFDLHRSVENAVSETLFAIEEGNECLAVIVGDVGLGKTMTLRVILDSLEPEKYRIAFVTNPDMTFIQLLKEIIGQLSGELCTESRREQILEVFNKVLFKTQAERKKVLIFIDEANAMKPSALESLRLLTNMQGDDENLFTIILAGQLELARRLEHPKRANLFQRIGVYSHLSKIESRDLMRDYIEHRLERAGTSKRVFSDEAYDAIWEYAEHGVPRLINKIAKLALKAGQTHGLQMVDGGVVRQIGSRFDRVSKAILPERRERVRDVNPMVREKVVAPLTAMEPVSSMPLMSSAPLAAVEEPVNRPTSAGDFEERPAQEPVPEEFQPKQPLMADIIKFPEHVYLKAKELPTDQRLKLAGQLAAEVLKRYPHLIQQLGSTNDPVPAWTILRNVVMRQLEQHLANDPSTFRHGL
jgi:type II secretory pathway predicted ATPase ExeA